MGISTTIEKYFCLFDTSLYTKKDTMSCNNCGNSGHAYHQCRVPITSCGLVVFRRRPEDGKAEYLMIRRRDTLGFLDFMRGKYSVYDKYSILNMVKQMTTLEKQRILDWPFQEIWQYIWSRKNEFTSEDSISREKLQQLRQGLMDRQGNRYTLASIIEEANLVHVWTEPEWGFPKGRRNLFETDYACAVREFCEETGYSASVDGKMMIPVKNIAPLEENFIGSNYKSYKHKYFVMYMDYAASMMPDRKIQQYEVSAAEWYSAPECAARIRSYNEEKLRILQDACAITDLLLRKDDVIL